MITRIKTYLAIAGAFVLALCAAFIKGRASGKQAAKQQSLDDELELNRKATDIEIKVGGMGKAAIDEGLDKWAR